MICDTLFPFRVSNILTITAQTGGGYFVQSTETALQAFQMYPQVTLSLK